GHWADTPVLLITGASSGIGAETARMAIARGRRVALAARSTDKLAALVEEFGGPDHAVAITTDVTDFASVEAAVGAAKDHFGRLDAVYANAGFGAERSFLGDDVDHWREMVLTNVLGAAFTIRAALPTLYETDGVGHLLLTGSVAGRVNLPGSLYSVTKWAVHAMGESLRQEVDGKVRVTTIAPGKVDTPFFDNPVTDALQPEDIARAVLYALDQPAHVDVNEILLRPTKQPN
ncbi:MAG: SDR family oxidoreductase, partial [Solirubrobacteraceae bacterium]|nr:SDR family oxidoreductase [Solirubrobacteraceae bacterium]